MTEVTTLESDAFVLFGATGDLAFHHVFPTLQALIRRGPQTPVHEYESNAWGPVEADQIIVADAGWHHPNPPAPTDAMNRERARVEP